MAEEITPDETAVDQFNPTAANGRKSPSPLLLRLRDFVVSNFRRPKPTYLPRGFPPHNPPIMYRLLMSGLSNQQDFPLYPPRLVSNIYEINPERLLSDVCGQIEDKTWLFFTLRGRKYENETVIYPAAGDGYWSYIRGADRAIVTQPSSGRHFGVCRSFEFCQGEDYPNYFLEEYRLSEYSYPATVSDGWIFGDWVLCKVFEFEIDDSPKNVLNPVVNSVLPSSNNLPSNNPPLCIPYLSQYYEKLSSPCNIPNPMTLEDALISLNSPPMVYLILIYALSNRGDQIDSGRFPVIPNMIMSNIYEINPCELAVFHDYNEDLEWFCFTIRSREYENDTILNRAVGDGYWLLKMGSQTAITTVEDDGSSIGVRRTFEFYRGNHVPGGGYKTCCVMHEFRLNEPVSEKSKVGDWVLYKIWNNKRTPPSGSQIVEHHYKRKRTSTSSEETDLGNQKEDSVMTKEEAA